MMEKTEDVCRKGNSQKGRKSGSKDVFNTKDLQRVTHSLSGPGSPGGLPLNKELDHLGSKASSDGGLLLFRAAGWCTW